MTDLARARGSARFTAEWWEHWTMPEPNTGCHLWMGTINRFGYGVIGQDKGKSSKGAHRLRYEQAFGPITDPEIKVCHRCDVPSCVNLDHLFLGTHADNMRDCVAKGRHKRSGSRKGPYESGPYVLCNGVLKQCEGMQEAKVEAYHLAAQHRMAAYVLKPVRRVLPGRGVSWEVM